MRRACSETLGIFLFVAVVAFTTNFVRSDNLPLIREKPAIHRDLSKGDEEGTFLTIEQFLGSMKRSEVVILDARPKEDFDEARIPGARSLPEDLCAEQFPQVLQSVAFEQEIVVYCSGRECDSAEEVAAFLTDVGFGNTKVYPGGWEEWEELGLPVESSY